MILIPKPKRIIRPPLAVLRTGISGEARCFLYDENLNLQRDTGWFPNLITTLGLNLFAKGVTPSGPFARTYIGSGNTAATNGDTQIETFLAQSDTIGNGNNVNVEGVATDYEFSQTRSRRFAAGVGTGTVREIAMGASADNSGTLIFNRVVLGTPISKAANQVLDVIFRLTIWPPATVDIIGTGGSASTIEGVSYETITRGMNYPETGALPVFLEMETVDSGSASWVAYNGNIGAITSSPSGNQGDSGTGDGLSTAAYVTNNFYVDVTYFAGLDDWVPAGGLGIRTLHGTMVHFGFQTQFDATTGGARIPKLVTQLMDFTWRFSWDRH